MIYLKIAQTKDGLAVLLNAEVQRLLGATDGGNVAIEVSDEGKLLLTSQDTSPGASRAWA